jgi:hypothetical protein
MELVMRLVAMICIAVILGGCAAPAKIRKEDGRVYDGVITGGDEDYIYMGSRKIEREGIIEIDHPGDGLKVAGIILCAIFGVGTIAGGATVIASGGEDDLEVLAMGFSAMMLSVGIFCAVYGYYLNNKSKEAAEWPREGEVKPVVYYDGERGYGGIGVWW